jgi:hypothetical protein
MGIFELSSISSYFKRLVEKRYSLYLVLFCHLLFNSLWTRYMTLLTFYLCLTLQKSNCTHTHIFLTRVLSCLSWHLLGYLNIFSSLGTVPTSLSFFTGMGLGIEPNLFQVPTLAL